MTVAEDNTTVADNPDTPLPPSLYRLLSDYWHCYDALEMAMAATDASEPDTADRASCDIWQAQAGERLQEASIAVLEFVPTRRFEAIHKTTFVETIVAGNGGMLYEDEVAALVSSLPTLFAPRQEGGAA